jgi:hypothetical protein
MRRNFLWLHGDQRGGIFGRPFFDAVIAAVINFILQRSYELERILGSSGRTKACRIWPGGLKRLCAFL